MRIWLLLMLLVALGATWWASRPEPAATAQETADEEQIQDYFVHDLDLHLFDPEGSLSHVLNAEHLTHFRVSGIALLKQPRYTLYEEKRPGWKIRADKGELSGDQSRLLLLGKTSIDWQGDERHPAMHLLTSGLTIHPREEYAETEAPVTVTSGENWIESTGMQAWLKAPGKIRFLAQTRAHYVAQ